MSVVHLTAVKHVVGTLRENQSMAGGRPIQVKRIEA